MRDYNLASEATARAVMTTFSTSFGLASRLFPRAYRQDIYNIYGLVRLADEIVDSYRGDDAAVQLNELEAATFAAMNQEFSTNLVLHAFQLSANYYAIDADLIKPFFASMRMDLPQSKYDPTQYEAYIYGSAEVVGLMCLKIFCGQDEALYEHLVPGAKALGSAFQKVNFLRDLAADHTELGRYYFPIGSFDGFDKQTKDAIVADIRADFAVALSAMRQLPRGARPAVSAAYRYYETLLDKITATPAEHLKQHRVRISDARKVRILGTTLVREKARLP